MKKDNKNIYFAVLDRILKVAPLAISALALWNTMVLNKKFIEPNIGNKLEFAIVKTEHGQREDKTLPEFNIYNAGPVKAVSLSVDHLISDVNIHLRKIQLSMMPGIEDIGNHFIFEKEFNVYDSKKLFSERIYEHKDNNIRVCIFDTQFFRESDMKSYKKRDIYFIENKEIYYEKQYRKMNENKYNIIMSVIGDIDTYKANSIAKTPKSIKTFEIRIK